MAILRPLLTFMFFSLIVLNPSGGFVSAQGLIPPARFDGFVYKNRLNSARIMIEAFLDPVCPDSRDSWPPLKQALDHYGSRLSLIVHPFPLPYHDNAFVSSRALHIANKLNASATYDLLELFFKQQEVFYSQATFNVSRATIVSQIVTLATKAVGSSYKSALASGFTDRKTDLKTRVSFKYGCSRGVFAAPTFFVNGFAVPEGDSVMDYAKWRSIIDPLLKEQAKDEGEELLHF